MELSLRVTQGGRTRCRPESWPRSNDWCADAKLYRPRAGRGWVRLDDNLTALVPGRLYLLPPYRRYDYGTARGFEVDWLHFSAQSPALDAQLAALGAVQVVTGAPVEFWARVADQFQEFIDRPTLALSCRTQALLLDVVGRAVAPAAPLPPAIERLLPAIRFMDDHVATTAPPLAAIAATVSLSPEHFHRLFRATFGATPFAYLEARRLARADRLLRGGGLPVKEVAARCGYDDPYYFSRAFRRRYGCSPRVARQGRQAPAP